MEDFAWIVPFSAPMPLPEGSARPTGVTSQRAENEEPIPSRRFAAP